MRVELRPGAEFEHGHHLVTRVRRGYAKYGGNNHVGMAARLPCRCASAVISNVRGAPFPLYFAGARLLANYPVGPIGDGFGLNVTVISYLDSLDFGLSVCPDPVEDPWRLVDALRAEEAELTGRYTKRPRRGREAATTRPRARRTGTDGPRPALTEP
ncbi:MAG: WS/DGAT domain-containing protein [Micromonosporaceae bacterium]